MTLKGGESGLTISSVAFADTTATDVTVRGNVQINKKAFRNNASLKNINISGNVSIGESAFSGCSAVTNLKIGGTTNIESYAFDGLTSLKSLYVPVGTTLHEYSFNGATALKKLEADVALPAHSFENGGAIDTLVLDKNVVSISYDWEGHSSSVSNRTVYVKNENMLIQYYGNGGTYYSPLGSSGDVIVYVPATSSVDLGESVNPSGDGILTLNGYTSYAHSGNYTNYIKGTTSSVTIRAKQNIDTQMEEDGVTSLKDTEVDKEQTGIDAYYNGTILTTKDIDKTNMTVTRMYGSEEGENYSVGEFYVVRTSEFNTEAKKDGGVTEDAIASYEPVHAADSDLDPGATTGTVSVTVIVFYDVKNSDGSVTARKYYSTPVSIRVEEYTSKSYIEQVYGSYDAIADKLVELDNQIAALQKELEKADVNSIEELTKELNEYKVAYAELVKTLEKYVSDNNQAGNGYFGTTKDDTTGETKDVIFINGNPTSYVDTGKTDSDGNTIYKVLYDVNGDGTAEETYIVVKNDGVHVVDQDGYPVKVNEKDVVYKDTLGALKRQAAAQLAEIKSQLADCDAGLQKIKKALEDAGYNFDTSDDQYTQIVDAINDMAGKVDSLTGNLENANSQIKSYASALDVIYTKLTGSSLSADQISGLANTLNAIVGKIQSLQNDLAVAKATVTDLQTQLNNAENKASQLQTELDSTKDELKKANTALDTAKNDLGYEAGVASVDVSENSEVYKNAYKAGVASVDVSENSAVYKNAYNAGYAAGKIAGGNSGNTSDSNGDYKNGYNTGYSEGVKSVNTSLYYNNGYNTGYAAGYKEGTSKSSGTSNTSGLSNQINTLTDQVNSLTNTNKDLYKQVTSLNTENSNLKSEISGLQSQLNTLKKNSSSTTSSTGSSSGTANTGTTASTNKESSTVNSTANSTSASSNKKTDTTNTENTFSTAKTADKPVSVVEDDVEMEGSTNVVAASTISSSSMKQLGESAQTQVPTTTEKAKDQKATITLNQIAADADAQISSNGASLTDATEAQKNNALKIINWYLNNLDELGKLGASEIRAAANDDNKSVVCDILASVDVVPSADQQTAIDNQEDVDLRLSSADIEDGALYLIVHESQLREGIYDVLLSRASGDSIEINIPDLSPVTVSKITVNDIEQLEMVTESTQTEETPEALVEEESSNTGFRIAMYILLIVAIGGLAALFFIAKKRNGGSIPFKRN